MSLLRKLFIIFFAVLIVPTIVLMGLNYAQTKDFFEDEAQLNNHQIVKQAKVANDSIISQTERISQQLAIDNSVQKLMAEELKTSDYDDYQVLDDTYNVMLNFMNSTQYIDEIAIYKLKEDLLVSTNTTEKPANSVKSVEYIQKLAETSSMKLWIEPNASGVFWEQSSAFHYVRFMYTNVDELIGFVVIRLKNTDFDRLINEMYIKDEGMLFIADQTGRIILSSYDEYGSIIDLGIDYKWFSQNENYKIQSLGDDEFLISMVTSDYNNWKYISMINTASLYNKLNVIMRHMIILLIFFVIISLVLSYWLSKEIYSPIQSIKDSLVGDGSKLKNRLLLEEKEFGQINSEITTLLDKIKSQKEANVDYVSKLSVLEEAQMFVEKKLHKYKLFRALKGEYLNEEELNLIRNELNGTKNSGSRIVIIELMNNTSQVFDMENSCIIEYFYGTSTRIVCLIEETAEYETYINELKLKCDNEDNGYIIVVSNKVDLESIRNSYDYLLKIIKYKLITNDLGFTFEKDFKEKTKVKRLPYDYHTYLNNSLRISSLEGCKIIIMELSEVLRNDFYFASNYSFYYKDALNTIIGFLYEIQYIKSQDMLEITNAFASFDSKFDTIDKAESWILQFITNIFTFINESQLTNEKSPIQMAIQIIENEYINDISLSEVAEQLNMSIPYLSKQFKEETGINFKEYITNCKIEHAKQLLLEGDNTIQYIAKQVGYNNSLQLVRMFKKKENITPTEYRQRNKKR